MIGMIGTRAAPCRMAGGILTLKQNKYDLVSNLLGDRVAGGGNIYKNNATASTVSIEGFVQTHISSPENNKYLLFNEVISLFNVAHTIHNLPIEVVADFKLNIVDVLFYYFMLLRETNFVETLDLSDKTVPKINCAHYTATVDTSSTVLVRCDVRFLMFFESIRALKIEDNFECFAARELALAIAVQSSTGVYYTADRTCCYSMPGSG